VKLLVCLLFLLPSYVFANTNAWELPRVEVTPNDPYKIDKYNVTAPANLPSADPVASASTYYSPQPQAVNSNTYKAPLANNNNYASAPRYMAVHLGTYFNQEAHKWGNFDYENPGKLNAGVTYRIGEWVNSMDLQLRLDYSRFEVENEGLSKISILPMIMFPDARSGFPLYFGAGLGLGLFLEQLENESHVSLDYQLITGLRFMDVYKKLGLFLESGIKGQLQVLKDGEYRGMFVSAGTVFNF